MNFNDIKPITSYSFSPSHPLIIAGPCSAESKEQVLSIASDLQRIGIPIFRAGVWKPRTKPGGFEGMGEAALSWLAEAKQSTGIAIATEVATGSHLLAAIDAGVDIVWIGARTTANPFAVQEIADSWASIDNERKYDIGVMVKNPVNSDIELWVGAFERLYTAGIRRLAAVHRGFSSYGATAYRNPPEWRIPIEFHRRHPNIPLICDPSHISGRSENVAKIAQQAMNLNFDGLMIETHCNPSCALSDAEQQLTPNQLKELLDSLVLPGDAENTSTELQSLRNEIDILDDRLIDILAKRMDVSRAIGKLKQEHGMPVIQTERYRKLVTDRAEVAAKAGLDPNFIKKILSVIHEESVKLQLK